MTLGESIRARRKALGMTQQELANRAGCTSTSTISKVETGDRTPSVSLAYKIAKALGAELHYDPEANCIILKGGEPKHVILRKRVQSPCSRDKKHGKDGAQDRRDKGGI